MSFNKMQNWFANTWNFKTESTGHYQLDSNRDEPTES